MDFSELFSIPKPEWLTKEQLNIFFRCGIILFFGIPFFKIISVLVGKFFSRQVSPQSALLAKKGILYGGVVLLFIMILHHLGFKLTAVLGAAGIVGVAVGFASQTSLSNLISGLFLIWEKPFMLGDVLKVGDTTGTVQSIDLLSVNLRTFDNQFVRIPNESLIKNQFVNVTRYPIRRMDIVISVAYKENISHVIRVLKEVAHNNPHSLDEPAPVIIFKNFGDSGLDFLLGIWFLKTDFLALKNSITQDLKERFDRENIEIPFPHRSLYTGSATEPFPIKIIDER